MEAYGNFSVGIILNILKVLRLAVAVLFEALNSSVVNCCLHLNAGMFIVTPKPVSILNNKETIHGHTFKIPEIGQKFVLHRIKHHLFSVKLRPIIKFVYIRFSGVLGGGGEGVWCFCDFPMFTLKPAK